MPINKSMNQSLLDEIDQLKQANRDQEEKYAELLGELQQDNCELREKLLGMDSVVEQDKVQKAAQFKSKCQTWQGIVDQMGRMTANDKAGAAGGHDSDKQGLLAKFKEQENSFFRATESFEQALAANDKTIQHYDAQLKQRNE